jgi:hypothetical protein
LTAIQMCKYSIAWCDHHSALSKEPALQAWMLVMVADLCWLGLTAYPLLSSAVLAAAAAHQATRQRHLS